MLQAFLPDGVMSRAEAHDLLGRLIMHCGGNNKPWTPKYNRASQVIATTKPGNNPDGAKFLLSLTDGPTFFGFFTREAA